MLAFSIVCLGLIKTCTETALKTSLCVTTVFFVLGTTLLSVHQLSGIKLRAGADMCRLVKSLFVARNGILACAQKF